MHISQTGNVHPYIEEVVDTDTTKNDKVDKKICQKSRLPEEFRQSDRQIDWTPVPRILISGSHSKTIISGSHAFKAQILLFKNIFAIKTTKVNV